MVTRVDLQEWLIDILRDKGGQARIVDICQKVWQEHRNELEASGDLFYTWQYDIRWAATKLRKKGELVAAVDENRGIWKLIDGGSDEN